MDPPRDCGLDVNAPPPPGCCVSAAVFKLVILEEPSGLNGGHAGGKKSRTPHSAIILSRSSPFVYPCQTIYSLLQLHWGSFLLATHPSGCTASPCVQLARPSASCTGCPHVAQRPTFLRPPCHCTRLKYIYITFIF